MKVKILCSICLFLFAGTAYSAPEKDTGNLGEIRHSILSIEKFQEIYGDGWVPMDGRDIQDSDLYKEGLWGETSIPDVRGRFLRSHNSRRGLAEGGDPSGDNPVGFSQSDEFKSHSHKDFKVEGIEGAWGVGIPGRGKTLRNVIQSNAKGKTMKILTGKEGALETRPKSVIVMTFIKINRTPDSVEKFKIITDFENFSKNLFKNGLLKNYIQSVVRGMDSEG